MSTYMLVIKESGANSDNVTVEMYDSSGKDNCLFKNKYYFGVNASWDRKFAKIAEDDFNNAQKYNWENKDSYELKPYIVDIIFDLIDCQDVKIVECNKITLDVSNGIDIRELENFLEY